MLKRILIVDDDQNLRLLVRTTLENSHYEIIEARNGNDALNRIREMPPDLLLLDWMMPEKSGIEVLQAMKEETTLAGIPVVMLTAKTQTADRQRAEELGVTAYLTKPFSPLELMEMVDTILKL